MLVPCTQNLLRVEYVEMSGKKRGSCLPPDASLQSDGFKIYSSPTSNLNPIPMQMLSSTPDIFTEENIYSTPCQEVEPTSDQSEIVR